MNKNGYGLVIIEKSQRCPPCPICAEVKATKFVEVCSTYRLNTLLLKFNL